MPKIGKIAGAGAALALAVLLTISFSFVMNGLQVKAAGLADYTTEEGILADGTYEISGALRNATNMNKASMGDAALKKPMNLTVTGGEGTLSMEFVSMSVTLGTAEFKGYLGEFGYLLSEGDSVPDGDAIYAASITAYYNVYDSYNDPDTGTDANVKGMQYPKKAEIPVTIGDDFIWVQVYVPVMESVSSGSGRQYARLILDWDSLNCVSGGIDEPEAEQTQADRSELKSQIAAAKKKAAKESVYTTATLNALKTAIRNAQTIYDDESADQTQIDEQTIDLMKAMSALKKRPTVDKSKLKTQLKKAKAAAKKTSIYTAATIKNLKEAIDAATKVYKDSDATSKEVSAQVKALKEAQNGLVKKTSKKLDKNNLDDGVYTLYGSMVKTNKSSASMANEAVSHQVILTVKKGKPYLTLSFHSMKISGQNGYLGTLSYYKTGYSQDAYGAPSGKLGSVSVDAYQTSGGKKVSDSLGSNYPATVTFPLISEGISDGYVPLQVFVPVMDAISSGTGTQSVYLKLDWSTLKMKSSDTDDFDDEKVDSDSKKTVSGGSNSGNSAKSGSNTGTKSVSAMRSLTSLPGTGTSSGGKTETGGTLQNKLLEGMGKTVSESQADSLLAGDTQASAATYETAVDQTSEGADFAALLDRLIPILLSALAVVMGVIYKVWSRTA